MSIIELLSDQLGPLELNTLKTPWSELTLIPGDLIHGWVRIDPGPKRSDPWLSQADRKQIDKIGQNLTNFLEIMTHQNPGYVETQQRRT